MRKIKFILTAVVMAAVQALPAQGIMVDKTEADGGRIICTSFENLYRGATGSAGFALMYDSKIDKYCMVVMLNEGKLSGIAEDRVLLFKTLNRGNVQLRNIVAVNGYDYTYRDGSYLYTAIYLIDGTGVDDLLAGYAVKLRLETDMGHLDREVDCNRFSRNLLAMRNLIDEQRKKSNTVYDNF